MFKSIAAACARGASVAIRGIPDLVRDAVGLSAVGLIAYGAWLIYEPAGYIVGGLLVLIGVIMNSGSKATRSSGG